jgi:hypothetical protein
MIKKTCILLFVLSSGCNACVNHFYGTHNHAYLNINFEDSSLVASLPSYIDSVLNKDIHFPDSIKSQFYINNVQTDLHEDDRLIHFKERPEEWYLIELQGNPCIINAIYNPQISTSVIFEEEKLSESQLTRIRNRMKTEIFDKARLYARKNKN